MGADKDAHTGDSTPKCVTCAQPCVLEQTSFKALRLDVTPTAHDTRESKDSSAVGYFPPTLMGQSGIPCDLRAIRSNGIPQSGNNHHNDGSMASPSRVDTKQDTLERQDSSVSPQIDDSAHEYVPFGTHDTGDDQDQSDEDMDREDVDNTDDNNNERAHGGLVDSWLKGMGMGMDERRTGIEDTLREFGNLMNPTTRSNMAQYGDEAELSDDMEMDQ
ncbi:hypothetical protein FIE12Z_5703 [Fusarium flagelliforme]|uniref:Uncharacterized protein n=1 Tax=Fusarium flagelliforme TaxID=2675880 RepID=A0A395MQI1_9HYPO|nr:hypothetical protein FIE12Z_5703 [Fusarium flagelliforme]